MKQAKNKNMRVFWKTTNLKNLKRELEVDYKQEIMTQ